MAEDFASPQTFFLSCWRARACLGSPIFSYDLAARQGCAGVGRAVAYKNLLPPFVSAVVALDPPPEQYKVSANRKMLSSTLLLSLLVLSSSSNSVLSLPQSSGAYQFPADAESILEQPLVQNFDCEVQAQSTYG